MKWIKILRSAVFMLLVVASYAKAEDALSLKLLERWAATNVELKPLGEQVKDFQNTEALKNYSEDPFEILTLSDAKQDELINAALKERGIYDDVQAVMDEYDWDNYGEFSRVHMRFSGLYMYKMQQDRGGQAYAPILEKLQLTQEDLDFLEAHWEQMQAAMTQVGSS
ncbi:hypothetical protein [uncultured Gilvimarinus sp.]|jgi:hypothetical protein|uniref:hypothetical protein n=1 Tax=uncultured Gilvimarinus sp. TaxID=1689143 RepID=UPI0030DD1EFA